MNGNFELKLGLYGLEIDQISLGPILHSRTMDGKQITEAYTLQVAIKVYKLIKYEQKTTAN